MNPVSNGETKMYLKDTFISSSFKAWLAIDEDTRMNGEKMHTTNTDCGTMLHLKDNLILSSFETWLSTDVITQLH
jgi:hypothetical protein